MGHSVTAGYLIDTNHLSRAVTSASSVRQRITDLRQRGIKVGTFVPVLCEIEAGIQQVINPMRIDSTLNDYSARSASGRSTHQQPGFTKSMQ